MSREINHVGPVPAIGGPAAQRVLRAAENQARQQGGAGNIALHSRLAAEGQRDRDLFTATRERPPAGARGLERAAAAAATGDHERPPRRSWLDLFKIRRRRRR